MNEGPDTKSRVAKTFPERFRGFSEHAQCRETLGAPGPPGRPAIVSVNGGGGGGSGTRSPRAGGGVSLNASALSGAGGMCGCSQETFLSLANQIRDVIPAGPPGEQERTANFGAKR